MLERVLINKIKVNLKKTKVNAPNLLNILERKKMKRCQELPFMIVEPCNHSSPLWFGGIGLPLAVPTTLALTIAASKPVVPCLFSSTVLVKDTAPLESVNP